MTRQEYLNKNAHREYYAQYVDHPTKQLVLRTIGFNALIDSNNKHFNDIPLRRWDGLVKRLSQKVVDKLKANGDYLSLGVGVCILKEAARQLVEEEKAKQ